MSEDLRAWMAVCGFDDIESRGENGSTPLLLATREGKTAFVIELLEFGANVNVVNNDNNNSLWNAVYAEDEKSIRAVIAHGISKDNRNVNGATPLLYAASNGKAEMVRLLLELGCDKTVRTIDDFDALELASTREVLALLK
jgi:uncharacterized protein